MKARKYTKETVRELGMYERNFPEFAIGDMVAVSQWVQEGETKRIQVFQGNVIARKNKGASSSFTVRKIGANGIAVERIYPYYSPIINSITLVNKGRVRRAKLYYIRERIGKKARIKEDVSPKAKEHMKKARAMEAKAKEQAAKA